MSDRIQQIARLSLEERIRLEEQLLAKLAGRQEERIPRRADDGPAPLSVGQERLWFLHQLHPNSILYNGQSVHRFEGQLQPEVLESVLHEIFHRHEVLRTAYRMQSELLVQIVQEEWRLPLRMVDLRDCDIAEQKRGLAEIARKEFDTSFDLAVGEVVRFVLIQCGAEEHFFIRTTHHIATDGWSHRLFWQEFCDLYEAFSRGEPSPLPEPPLQYADFAEWQRSQMDTPAAKAHLAYWRRQLAHPPTFGFPVDYRRPRVQSGERGQIVVTLPAEQVDKLYALGRMVNATPYASMLALFNALISRFTGQDDFCIGASVLGRSKPELMEIQGFFINNLILRFSIRPNNSFSQLLESSGRTVLDALAHQDYPFDRLLSELQMERDLSRNPLAQIRFAMTEINRALTRDAGDLRIHRVPGITQLARYDLHLRIEEQDGETKAIFSYNTDVFAPDLIEQMARSMPEMLAAAVADPAQSIGQLLLQTEVDTSRIVREWNATAADFPLDLTFPELFAEQAALQQDRMAAADPTGAITWRELDIWSEQLAAELRANGVKAGDMVALLCRRNRTYLAALLAILRSGAVYLPLDPRNPLARHQQMVKQSGCRYLMASQEYLAIAGGVTAQADGVAIILEQSLADKRTRKVDLPSLRPTDIAYLLYTSGSTGAPKGALVEHRGMLNHLFAKIGDLGLTPADRIAQTAPQSFDISIWQFLVGLLCGGSVHIYPDEIALNPASLLAQIRRDGVTVLEVVPTLLRALLDELERNPPMDLPMLRWLIPTGEALPPELCNRWLALYPDIPLLNAYGPTECSDDVTHHVIREPLPETALRTPIGRPIANMQAYILDEQRRICPVGMVGELWIGGVGVGPGYLNDPHATAAAFVPDPYRSDPNARLYRTGDLARYRADGLIEFFGRTDSQVKIRGARVELEEIEAVLRAHPNVEDGAVIFHQGAEADRETLAAFIVASSDTRLDLESLRIHLRHHLPEHMIPTRIEQMEALPLTANGKVDRGRLVEHCENQTGELVSERAVAPRTPLEAMLVEVWARVLRRDNIGVHDNFFDLGGDSIRAAIVVNDLQTRFEEIVYVVAIFDAPTIESLARYLAEHYPAGVARCVGSGAARETQVVSNVDEQLIEQFRTLIPTVRRRVEEGAKRNRQAVFVLSAPRSGSTLFRIMLAGHSQLFAPPELDLLGFGDMAQRRETLSGRWSFRQEGLLRAVMELRDCDADAARRLVGGHEEAAMPVTQFYALMQGWLGDRRLVDKTPIYALDPATLRRAEEAFENPLYIHLLRHPLGMIQSFEQARTDQVFLRQSHDYSPRTLAELVWQVSHRNILDFLAQVPAERQIRIRFEELVAGPDRVMQGVCDLLQIELEPTMLNPYDDSVDRMTDGLYPVSRMLGDVRFHTHGKIDPTIADRWRTSMSDYELGLPVRDLARKLGYVDVAPGEPHTGKQTDRPALSIPVLNRNDYRISSLD